MPRIPTGPPDDPPPVAEPRPPQALRTGAMAAKGRPADDPSKPGRELVSENADTAEYIVRDAEGKYLGKDLVAKPRALPPAEQQRKDDREAVKAAVAGWASLNPKGKDDALLAALRLLAR